MMIIMAANCLTRQPSKPATGSTPAPCRSVSLLSSQLGINCCKSSSTGPPTRQKTVPCIAVHMHHKLLHMHPALQHTVVHGMHTALPPAPPPHIAPSPCCRALRAALTTPTGCWNSPYMTAPSLICDRPLSLKCCLVMLLKGRHGRCGNACHPNQDQLQHNGPAQTTPIDMTQF
jgi:hypothetical protein